MSVTNGKTTGDESIGDDGGDRRAPHKRTRMSPEARRDQLIDYGLAMVRERPLEEITIDAIADAVLSRLANNGSKLTLIGEDMRTRDDFQEERGTLSKQLKQRQRSKR